MSKKPFNSAFDGLAKIKVAEKPAAPAPAKVAPVLAPPDGDGAEAFLRAMQGVDRIEPDLRGERQRPEPRAKARETEDEALIDLASTLDPERELLCEEPLKAAWARSLDRKIVKRLRAGEIPWADSLDLHGLRREPAERDLEKFLLRALKEKVRCVLVVTGRGANSEDGAPVLKPMVADALRRGRLVKHVLAYTESHPRDGGDGAYYVLLRRR